MHSQTFPSSTSPGHTNSLSNQFLHPVLHCKCDWAHSNSKALSIADNLPGVQSTGAIGTAMPFRTLTEASATKASGFPVTDTTGKIFVYFL